VSLFLYFALGPHPQRLCLRGSSPLGLACHDYPFSQQLRGPNPGPCTFAALAARHCLSRLSAKSAVLPQSTQSTPRIPSDVFLGALGVLGGQRFFAGPSDLLTLLGLLTALLLQ